MPLKLLFLGAYGAAAVSVLAGVFLFTPIPKELGFYRAITKFNPVLVGLLPLFHHGIPWKYTWEEFDKVDFKGQRAIVTGANSGIGLDMSHKLAKAGTSLTMVCRNPTKCENAKNQILQELGSAVVDTMTMDTSSLKSVRAFAETYTKAHGQDPIDMMFMNAGTNFIPAPGESTKCSPQTKEDGLEYLFQVNYLGHHLMYRLLEPLIAKSKKARIIQTSSASSYMPYKKYKVATDLETLNGCSVPFINKWTQHNDSYGSSKLAQILWVKALTRMLPQDSNIYANAFHPGAVDTPIMDKIVASAGEKGEKMKGIIDKSMRFAWKSPDGALTGIYLGVNPEDVRGKYYHPQAQEVVNPFSLDEKLQDDLWKFSEELIEDFMAPFEVAAPAAEVEEPVEDSAATEEAAPVDEETDQQTEEESHVAKDAAQEAVVNEA